jgi:hypothetical protein
VALCLQSPDEVEALVATVTAAASGLGVMVGTELAQVLAAVVPSELELLVIDAPLAPPGALEVLMSVCPRARALVITEIVSEAQLVSAIRLPRLIGFVARTDGQVRHWELTYVVRRLITPDLPVPPARALLSWWGANWSFRPSTPRDLDRVARAVDLAACWAGMPEAAADLAGRAAQVLATNAMYHAPIDGDGNRRYAPDWRPDRLMDDEVPELRLTVDETLLAVEAHDRFGRLPRSRAFTGLLRPDQAGAHAGIEAERVGLGFFRLFYSAAILRFDVTPHDGTFVSWIHDRRITRRSHQGQARSVYFLG